MNEKQFHKLDKIVLHEDELREISRWVEQQDFKTVDIPLHECFVIINGIAHKKLNLEFNSGIHFRITNDTIKITQYDMKDFSEIFTATVGERFFAEQMMDIEVKDKIYKLLGEEQLNKVAKACILSILDIFQYMTHKKESVIESKTKRMIKKVSKRGKSTSRNKKPNYVKIHSNKYTFDVTAQPNRKYNRHTESWTVRGHWRYYKKSGKRVWIDGYVKGNGNIEGKVYKI